MIYFESSTAASFTADNESPYYKDKYGNIHRKEDVDQFMDTYNKPFYRDLFIAAEGSPFIPPLVQ
jgi:hypothetical protein